MSEAKPLTPNEEARVRLEIKVVPADDPNDIADKMYVARVVDTLDAERAKVAALTAEVSRLRRSAPGLLREILGTAETEFTLDAARRVTAERDELRARIATLTEMFDDLTVCSDTCPVAGIANWVNPSEAASVHDMINVRKVERDRAVELLREAIRYVPVTRPFRRAAIDLLASLDAKQTGGSK